MLVGRPQRQVGGSSRRHRLQHRPLWQQVGGGPRARSGQVEGSRVGAEKADLRWTGGNAPVSAETPEVGTSVMRWISRRI